MSYGKVTLTLQALGQYRPGTILLVEKEHISSRQKTKIIFEFFIRKFEASSFEEVAAEIDKEVTEVNLKNAFALSKPQAQETIRTAHTGLRKLRDKFDAHHQKAAVAKLDQAIGAIENVASDNNIDLTKPAVQLAKAGNGSSPSSTGSSLASTSIAPPNVDPYNDEQRSVRVADSLKGETRRANSKSDEVVRKQQQIAADMLAAEEKERAAQSNQQPKSQPAPQGHPVASPSKKGSLTKPAETTPLLTPSARQLPAAEVNSNVGKARAQKQQAYVQSMTQFKADLVSLGYSIGVIELAIHNLKTHPTFKGKWVPIFDKLEQGIAFSSDPKKEATYRKELMDTIELYLRQNLSQLTKELSERK